MSWYIVNNELCHHGIDGQKWGVRNGPPYPLNRTSSGVIKTVDKDNLEKKYQIKDDNGKVISEVKSYDFKI